MTYGVDSFCNWLVLLNSSQSIIWHPKILPVDHFMFSVVYSQFLQSCLKGAFASSKKRLDQRMYNKDMLTASFLPSPADKDVLALVAILFDGPVELIPCVVLAFTLEVSCIMN